MKEMQHSERKKHSDDKVIVELPFYYGQAVRRDTGNNAEALNANIMATFFHCTSTDENPQHKHCPPAEAKEETIPQRHESETHS